MRYTYKGKHTKVQRKIKNFSNNKTNSLTCLGNVNIYSHQGFKCPIKSSQPFEREVFSLRVITS